MQSPKEFAKLLDSLPLAVFNEIIPESNRIHELMVPSVIENEIMKEIMVRKIKLISERDEAIRNELRNSLKVVNYKPEEGKD